MLLRRCATTTLSTLHPTTITAITTITVGRSSSRNSSNSTRHHRPCHHQPPPNPQPPTANASPALPPLTPAEFRGYNRLAEHMDHFHAHFRRTWTALHGAATSGRWGKPHVASGLAFLSQLETHHGIEETYIFPVLARRMPEFQSPSSSTSSSSTTSSTTTTTSPETDNKGNGNDNGNGADNKKKAQASSLLRQHEEIHRGMEGMEACLRAGAGAGELAAQMDTWGPVLWRHLDQEVEALGAENMRRYWTIDEIRRIPI
ncbi:hypothetical protein F4775DRAFT_593249 [Biscogniauxia sp. FL1348]|nr:hypothetical protein F4775DRAFT_593249 [Biscogniauxia sp. FL1348]